MKKNVIRHSMLSITILLNILVSQCQAEGDGAKTEDQCATAPLAKSVNDFGAILTNALDEKNNLFISPFSIYNALAMTYIGAGGKTAQQMEEAFQFKESGLDKQTLNEAFHKYLTEIKSGREQYTLLAANAIFLQKNYIVNENFVSDVKEFYLGVAEEKDFASNGKQATDDVNKFVSDNTNGKIEKLFEETLKPNTILVLVNAIYFKGIWKIQFPKEGTTDGIFYKNDGSTTMVKYMTLINQEFRYFEDQYSNYKFLELPYEGEDISMLLALPKDSTEVPKLDITTDALCSINGSLKNTEMNTITIPKFQLKYRKELVEPLQKTGIQDLFDNEADLTGISAAGGLHVSQVVHEAVIVVNEEGSEAAASTGVVVVESASLNVYEFVANHPFLVYIIDRRWGLVLFSGRVSEIRT